MPPLLIGTAISAAAGLGAAKMQSSAAKNAAKSQQAGTDRALQVQQQAAAPYMQLGQAAAGRLGEMGANPQPYTQQFGGPQRSTGFQAFNPTGGQPPTLGSLGQPPQGMQATDRPLMPPGRGPGGAPGGGIVTLQAPTGETVRLAAGPQVDMAIQRGARRIG